LDDLPDGIATLIEDVRLVSATRGDLPDSPGPTEHDGRWDLVLGDCDLIHLTASLPKNTQKLAVKYEGIEFKHKDDWSHLGPVLKSDAKPYPKLKLTNIQKHLSWIDEKLNGNPKQNSSKGLRTRLQEKTDFEKRQPKKAKIENVDKEIADLNAKVAKWENRRTEVVNLINLIDALNNRTYLHFRVYIKVAGNDVTLVRTRTRENTPPGGARVNYTTKP
jgi:hypothetical protein